MKKNLLLTTLAITFTALALSGATVVVAQSPTATPISTPAPSPTHDPQHILDQAQEAIQQATFSSSAADKAMSTVNMLLAFIQLFGLVVTLVTALAAIFGVTSINQFRQKMDSELTARANEVMVAQDALRQEKERTFEAMAEARSRAEAQLAELAGQVQQVREATARATRALALMQLGEQQLELNNRRGALQLYELAYETDPDNPAINYFLGELLLHERQIERGLELLRRAQEPTTGHEYAPVEGAIGYALRLQGEQATDEADRDLLLAQAVKQLQRALAIDNNVLNLLRESFHGSLAGLYKRQQRYDLAIQSYERAHEVTPLSTYPVINLANLHFWKGSVERALPYYEQSERNASYKLDRNPADLWARMNRMVSRIVLGNVDGAQNDLDELRRAAQRGHLSSQDIHKILADLQLLEASPQPPAEIEQFNAAVKSLLAELRVTRERSTLPA